MRCPGYPAYDNCSECELVAESCHPSRVRHKSVWDAARPHLKPAIKFLIGYPWKYIKSKRLASGIGVRTRIAGNILRYLADRGAAELWNNNPAARCQKDRTYEINKSVLSMLMIEEG